MLKSQVLSVGRIISFSMQISKLLSDLKASENVSGAWTRISVVH